MKHLALFILFIITATSFSCDKKPDGYTISGVITNGKNKTILLQELNVDNMNLIDSVKLDEKGRFSFQGKTHEPLFMMLRMDQDNFILFVVDSLDQIKIKADAGNLQKTYTIEGSRDSKLIKEIASKQNTLNAKVDSLGKIYQQYQTSPSFDSVKMILDAEYQKYFQSHRGFLQEFIKNNPSSLVSLIALSQQISRSNFLTMDEDFDLFTLVDDSLNTRYPNSKHSKSLHSVMLQVKQQKQMDESRAKSFNNGQEAPEIALPSPNGDTLRLSSLRGKYVLLDFWASWCRPCMMENPTLVENYKKYHDKGFEIFQVSLDRDKYSWTNAIKNNNLNWYHVSDLQFWNSPAAKLYQVQSIPANFLLDKDGKIIARNLRGPALGQKLEEIFNY